jgi:CubicO group peptidase (beta-lactamase class C family)/beta-glucosidase-like glycosyl hydrolase
MAKRLFQLFVFLLIVLELLLLVHTLFFYKTSPDKKKETTFLNVNTAWADTTLKKMTLNEKVGQLFMLKLNKVTINDKEELQNIVKEISPGGICFSLTRVNTQILLTNSCKAVSNTPLLIGSEGTILNQADFNFPTGMILKACKDSSFIMHYIINFAKILSNASVNIDFSTSLHEISASNTSSNYFSDNKLNNLKLAKNINQILNDLKIISCINKFTEFQQDSLQNDSIFHAQLKESLKEFSALKIDTPRFVKNIPDSIGKYLKNKFQFNGLLFSDLNENITDSVLLNKIRSGIDILMVKKNLKIYISRITRLITEGLLSEKEIDTKVRRILLAKTWFGIHKPEFQSAEHNLQKIYTTENKQFSWEIYENSTTLLKNDKIILPFREFSNKKVLLYTLGNKELPILKKTLSYYFDFKTKKSANGKLFINKRKCTHLILAISDDEQLLFSDTVFIKNLEKLSKSVKLIVLNFNSPLISKKLNFAHAIIQLYDTHPFSQSIAAQTISGAIKPNGILPVQIAGFDNLQVYYNTINRLQYTIPEKAGFDSYFLRKIDTIIEHAEHIGASPGYQILAARNGKVFFHKAYGYHTYARRQKVKTSDLFDLASITKVAATTLATMKLFEWDSIRMDDSIKYYIDDTINCTIKNHQLRDFYIHQTGLLPDMPVLGYITYKDSVNDAPDKYFTEKNDSVHTIKVAENFYLRKDWKDTIIQSLYQLEYDTNKTYKYSDINQNIAYDIIRRKMNKPVNRFVFQYFYNPLYLRTMGYLPLERFNKKRIVPTQKDRYWRKQLLQGYVHDESAALYGGVAGNAGLFSNANDLAILFQMLLNGGTYAGKRLLKPKTIQYFIQSQEDSPRGLGFNRKKGGLFGHSGFTGCVVWANPHTGLIFIFLSNSIHPRATNRRLKRNRIRQQVYEAVLAAQISNHMKFNKPKDLSNNF